MGIKAFLERARERRKREIMASGENALAVLLQSEAEKYVSSWWKME